MELAFVGLLTAFTESLPGAALALYWLHFSGVLEGNPWVSERA